MRTLYLVLFSILLGVFPAGQAVAEGRFNGDVVAKWLPNGRDMELSSGFSYTDKSGKSWEVPKGAIVDGASIPRPLWSLVGSPFTGQYRKASVVHDFFCQTMSRPWQDVHRVFFEAAVAEGNTPAHAKMLYAAVYTWGPRWDIVNGKAVKTRSVAPQPSETEFQELSAWVRTNDPTLDAIARHADKRFPRTEPLETKRVALVIGNSDYQFTSKLTNPSNDASDISSSLKDLGYTVIEGINLDKAAMDQTIRKFSRALTRADVGIFFYAGHGLQVSGRNYLVPIDARLEDASGLDFETIPLDLIQKNMERETKTNIVFLDACRDNPLARNLARSMGSRSSWIGRGLASVESGVGTLISFSTQPGNVALDGAGRNSPFAEALTQRIRTSAAREDLSSLLIGVRNDVMAKTNNGQIPWEHSALRAKFYFSPPQEELPPSFPNHMQQAAQAWEAVKSSTNVPILETYAVQFSGTIYAALARERIEDLQRKTPETGAKTETSKASPDETTRVEMARKQAADQQRQLEEKKLADAAAATAAAIAAEKARLNAEAVAKKKADDAVVTHAKAEAEQKRAATPQKPIEKKLPTATETDASCIKKFSNQGTCSQSLDGCTSSGGTLKNCNSAYRECIQTGRWIYRASSGKCFDWGLRGKS